MPPDPCNDGANSEYGKHPFSISAAGAHACPPVMLAASRMQKTASNRLWGVILCAPCLIAGAIECASSIRDYSEAGFEAAVSAPFFTWISNV